YGVYEGLQKHYYKGRRPCGFLVPRFQNLPGSKRSDFLRGYNFQGHGERQEWSDKFLGLTGAGKEFKKQLTTPGAWTVWMAAWGECLPYEDNRISLSASQKDKWGLPQIEVRFSFRENENAMMKDAVKESGEMLEKAGFINVDAFNY